MKKTHTFLFVMFLLAGFIQEIKSQEITIDNETMINKQVDSVFMAMVKLAENLDYDHLGSGVDESRHAGFIVNNNYYSSYDSLINILKSNVGSVKSQHISIKKKKITVLSDRLALLTTSGISQFTTEPGRIFEIDFYWSFVYEKTGTDWKVIHSHQSANR